jgi:hypothetical protein
MADLKVNNITNYDGTAGPVIAGVSTVLSTSHFVVPVGNTFKRSVTENIVNDGLVLYLDAGNDVSYDAYENLLTNSDLGQQVTGSGGTGYSVSTDNTVVNPFGTYGATKIVVSSSGSGYTRQGGSFTFTAGVTYTFSCFFKNESVNLSNITNSTFGSTFGIVIQSFSPTYDAVEGYFNLVPTTSYSNGWLRKSYTFTATYSQTYACSFSSAPNSPAVGTYYLYGFQLETGSTASTYYPTTASTKTRGITLIDLSGNNNTGTLVNGPTYSSANGGSIVFDGVDDYVIATRPSSIVAGGQITISLWAKWITTGTTTSTIQMLLDNNHSGAPQGFVIQDRPDLGKSLTFSVIPNQNGAVSTFIVGDGSWHHITGTNDGSTSKLYIDGVFNSKATESGGIISVYPNITLGLWQNGGRYLNGNISTTQIYNRALSAAEVSQNFNALRPRYGI